MQVVDAWPHPSAEDLSAFGDTELARGAGIAVQRHLRSCRACAAIALSFDEVRRLLRRAGTLPSPSIPAGALPWQREMALRA